MHPATRLDAIHIRCDYNTLLNIHNFGNYRVELDNNPTIVIHHNPGCPHHQSSGQPHHYKTVPFSSLPSDGQARLRKLFSLNNQPPPLPSKRSPQASNDNNITNQNIDFNAETSELIDKLNNSILDEKGNSFLTSDFLEEFGQADNKEKRINVLRKYRSLLETYVQSPSAEESSHRTIAAPTSTTKHKAVPSTSVQNTLLDPQADSFLDKVRKSHFSEKDQSLLIDAFLMALSQASNEKKPMVVARFTLIFSRDNIGKRISNIEAEFFGNLSTAEKIDFEKNLFNQFDKKTTEEQHKIVDGYVFTLLTMPHQDVTSPEVPPRNTSLSAKSVSPLVPAEPESGKNPTYALFKKWHALRPNISNF